MLLVFDIPSSVAFWRKAYPLDKSPQGPVALPLQACACKWADVREIAAQLSYNEQLMHNGKFYLLGFSENCRRKSLRHTVHTLGDTLPFGSFYELKPGIFVESPEFMFLRAASVLPFAQLIAFGDELCGLYSFAPEEKRGFRKRKAPLCKIAQLQHYIASSKGRRGHSRASAALPFVVERSASPMETFDEMTMCLPYRYGGYGIPQPIMNLPVSLDQKASRISSRSKCYLDMGWEHQHLDVEHHGKLDHSSEEDRMSDRARVNALKVMGFEVIELTHDQVDDLFAYEYIIEYIAGKLGKRIDKAQRGAIDSRIALRNELRSWNASSGEIVW